MPELLMVTVIIAIVAALALMQFGGSKGQFERQNVSQQLKQAFERARQKGFEPPTSCSGGKHFIRLSYWRVGVRFLKPARPTLAINRKETHDRSIPAEGAAGYLVR